MPILRHLTIDARMALYERKKSLPEFHDYEINLTDSCDINPPYQQIRTIETVMSNNSAKLSTIIDKICTPDSRTLKPKRCKLLYDSETQKHCEHSFGMHVKSEGLRYTYVYRTIVSYELTRDQMIQALAILARDPEIRRDHVQFGFINDVWNEILKGSIKRNTFVFEYTTHSDKMRHVLRELHEYIDPMIAGREHFANTLGGYYNPHLAALTH